MSLPSLPQEGQTLASTIGSLPKRLKEWESFKLSSESELQPYQFHNMFWGKSMADEEQEWRDAQGTGLGNERQGGDEAMDVDVSVEVDGDDDIIEGCYFLEIGIEGFQLPRIWIRAEYVRIYNALEDRHRTPYYPPLAPAVVITGQPGIGES
jgi:hypothetical protein